MIARLLLLAHINQIAKVITTTIRHDTVYLQYPSCFQWIYHSVLNSKKVKFTIHYSFVIPTTLYYSNNACFYL